MSANRAAGESSSWRRRLPVGLVVAHWIVCLLFLALRPPDPAGSRLDQMEHDRHTDEFHFNSADPFGWVAERPLNNWSGYHGGECPWVKLLIVLNLAPTLATFFAMFFLDPVLSSPVREQTWIAGWIFLVLSTAQWWLVGMVVARRARGLDRVALACTEATELES